MLTISKTTKGMYFLWNGKPLDDYKAYFVTVLWPNGVEEVLTLTMEMDYEGWADYPVQHVFLTINHNGLKTEVEILERSDHLEIVKGLSETLEGLEFVGSN